VFNDIIFITMKQHVSSTRSGEIDERFRMDLSAKIENDVRNRIDPGITFQDNRRAHSVSAQPVKGGAIQIKEDKPEKAVLKPDRTDEPGRPVLDRPDTVNDLFKPSSGVPSVTNSGGELRVAFRTVRDVDLFSRPQDRQDAEIKRIIDNTIQFNSVDLIDNAVKQTSRRYPSDGINSEEET